ncbi:membrane protein insertase YidC [uncultured Abyssibacter sp.]|uniref:membrane protein insertase YidC n=1 Tax=uncultured Abyssibacter sp. TaxID=2320202 RepID=UPI0032B20072
MESIRFPLIAALAVIGFFMYQAWKADQVPPEPRSPSPIEQIAGDDDVPDLDASPTASSDAPQAESSTDESAPVEQVAPSTETIVVTTDVMRAFIDPQGGNLIRVELLDYPVEADSEEPLALLHQHNRRFFVVQTGLLGEGAPTHKVAYRSERRRYAMQDGQALDVPLTWTDGAGRQVTKIYRFEPGRYVIGLDYAVSNATEAPWAVSAYGQVWRTQADTEGGTPFVRQFDGATWYEQKPGETKYRFRKADFEKIEEEPLDVTQTGGWAGMMEHYFIAAVIPPAEQTVRLVTKPSSSTGYLAQLIGEKTEVAAGGSETLTQRLYIGPKLQKRMQDVAPGLQLSVDYGLLTPLSEPLFWIMDKVHSVVLNWGLTIILVTLAIKLAFFKLSEAQYRSMAKMRKFAPRIQSIKDRYGDDRQKMQQAMMDLYKKEGFNPFAGCWPMLVQFPVFIALYWVLLESVELRQAPFFLWIQDLSAPDPYFVLPVLFGISMYFQQKLSGQAMTMDPMQQKIMSAMPIGLAAFFTFFPSGLVLYWFVSNLVGIAQQWYIYRKLETEGLGRK